MNGDVTSSDSEDEAEVKEEYNFETNLTEDEVTKFIRRFKLQFGKKLGKDGKMKRRKISAVNGKAPKKRIKKEFKVT